MTTAVEPYRRARSVSQLNDFLRCGWYYRLKRIVKVSEPPSVWLAGGTAFHAATEGFDLSTWQENDLSAWADPEPWVNLFEELFEAELVLMREKDPNEANWKAAKKGKEDVEWWRENGKVFVAKYVEWRVSTADTLRIASVMGAPGIEVEVITPLGGVEMNGKADRLFEDVATGALLIVDLKSGSSTPDSPIQLATYSIQLEEMLGRPVLWGQYYDARKGALTKPINLAMFTADKAGVMFRNLDTGINAGVFVPNVGENCFGCSLRSACVFQGGTEPVAQIA